MDDQERDKRVKELERRIRQLENDLRELRESDTRRHGSVMRLAALGMALSEVLQKKKLIGGAEFEKRIEEHLNTLDREISDKKIASYLERIWREYGSGKDE
ncbi:MAG TPA: hypothetical protein VJ417_08335 [Candidatus Glassbacteria bacterium]|nr:hypothetical protein [Candidatus Glassbacteria bacterium]